MREFRTADLANIGLAIVIILLLVLVAAVFIYQSYQRYKRLSRSGCDETSGTTVEIERMMELV